MMDQTEMENRRIDYMTRVVGVDRHAWMREEPVLGGNDRTRGIAGILSLSRQVGSLIRRAARSERTPGSAIAPAR